MALEIVGREEELGSLRTFVDQVGRDQDCHAFLVTQPLQVQPKIVARSGIESDRRFIQNQQFRFMSNCLSQFRALPHAS